LDQNAIPPAKSALKTVPDRTPPLMRARGGSVGVPRSGQEAGETSDGKFVVVQSSSSSFVRAEENNRSTTTTTRRRLDAHAVVPRAVGTMSTRGANAMPSVRRARDSAPPPVGPSPPRRPRRAIRS